MKVTKMKLSVYLRKNKIKPSQFDTITNVKAGNTDSRIRNGWVVYDPEGLAILGNPSVTHAIDRTSVSLVGGVKNAK